MNKNKIKNLIMTKFKIPVHEIEIGELKIYLFLDNKKIGWIKYTETKKDVIEFDEIDSGIWSKVYNYAKEEIDEKVFSLMGDEYSPKKSKITISKINHLIIRKDNKDAHPIGLYATYNNSTGVFTVTPQ